MNARCKMQMQMQKCGNNIFIFSIKILLIEFLFMTMIFDSSHASVSSHVF
jgi:hypothetical protein